MKYVTIPLCRAWVFSFIHQILTKDEPASDYEHEPTGLADLEKVLAFVQNDLYYPTFEEKAAYLICSIAGAQYFMNGNKRLAVVTLLSFLVINRAQIGTLTTEEFENLLRSFFPSFSWTSQPTIKDPHAQFLYNLAILIGDPPSWGDDKFDVLKEKVAGIFKILYRLPLGEEGVQ